MILFIPSYHSRHSWHFLYYPPFLHVSHTKIKKYVLSIVHKHHDSFFFYFSKLNFDWLVLVSVVEFFFQVHLVVLLISRSWSMCHFYSSELGNNCLIDYNFITLMHNFYQKIREIAKCILLPNIILRRISISSSFLLFHAGICKFFHNLCDVIFNCTSAYYLRLGWTFLVLLLLSSLLVPHMLPYLLV